MSIVRLFLDTKLHQDAEVALERKHAHYLFNVMRLGVGGTVTLFNGTDGEWRAEIIESGKKRGTLRAVALMRPQTVLPDIELLFAPIKKARTDFIVEKACELGCRRVQPVFTRYTNSERLNLPRLRAHMIEAAEQCDGLNVPILSDPAKLFDVLSAWPDRTLIFCDEARTAPPLDRALGTLPANRPVSVLIGPEGGFAPEEAERLYAMPSTLAVSLGPRILRADTAAIAALSIVQTVLGDWTPP